MHWICIRSFWPGFIWCLRISVKEIYATKQFVGFQQSKLYPTMEIYKQKMFHNKKASFKKVKKFYTNSTLYSVGLLQDCQLTAVVIHNYLFIKCPIKIQI